ncbi:hypothetical protein GCM10010252_38770 [Streptomyces aureoverticillatus]|nr:hypothetical protein GCM10010252_38770 [Streptomyces aureoverticillatus]
MEGSAVAAADKGVTPGTGGAQEADGALHHAVGVRVGEVRVGGPAGGSPIPPLPAASIGGFAAGRGLRPLGPRIAAPRLVLKLPQALEEQGGTPSTG